MSSKYHAGILSFVLGLIIYDISAADAAKARKSVPQSRDSLYASCRHQIFRQYGWKGHDGKRYLRRNFLYQLTDICVANGGKAI